MAADVEVTTEDIAELAPKEIRKTVKFFTIAGWLTTGVLMVGIILGAASGRLATKSDVQTSIQDYDTTIAAPARTASDGRMDKIEAVQKGQSNDHEILSNLLTMTCLNTPAAHRAAICTKIP